MIPDPDCPTDAMGRSRTKVCLSCRTTLGRTLRRCRCGHEFIGHDRARRQKIREKKGLPRWRDPDFAVSPEVAADAERQLIALDDMMRGRK